MVGDSIFIDGGFLDTIPINDTISLIVGSHIVTLYSKHVKFVDYFGNKISYIKKSVFIQPDKLTIVSFYRQDIEEFFKQISKSNRTWKISENETLGLIIMFWFIALITIIALQSY